MVPRKTTTPRKRASPRRSRAAAAVAARETREQFVEAEIGRFDNELTRYSVPVGSTVAVLLSKAGFSSSDSQEILDSNGDVVRLTDPVKMDEEYFLAANYESGK